MAENAQEYQKTAPTERFPDQSAEKAQSHHEVIQTSENAPQSAKTT
ncbi:MAG: hypothetical protein RBU21_11225 [FCB group bacterium]|jgi:hypothetical protein|nr:hypothetical protein [FCB group bacterium]